MRAKKDGHRQRTGEDAERRLTRRIRVWAETWRRCPRKGCRRAGECQNFDDCAGVSKEPYWPSEEDQRLYFRPLLDALRAKHGGRALHDPDARERDRPMPPAPPRIAPPSRPGAVEPPAPDDAAGSASRDIET